MLEASDALARRRLTLIVITLATLPCYCIGWLALALAPDSNPITPTPTLTSTIGPTVTGTLQIQTLSLTPPIVTGTITNTPTLTPSPTSTSTPTVSSTPFQPITNTASATFIPTRTFTMTPSPTFTSTFISTPTYTLTFTPSSTFTSSAPTNTPTITPFPTTP